MFNFRSEARRFDGSTRCLITADGFYEFTEAQSGQKRKTKWLFTMTGEPWFWTAGIVRDGAFAMLTTAPGPDIAPYRDRQVVLLPPSHGIAWLDLSQPEDALLEPLPAAGCPCDPGVAASDLLRRCDAEGPIEWAPSAWRSL